MRDLHKRFGTLAALRGLSFEALPGEVLGLLGPNGAGKTTTMRILATLLRPTAGRAEVCGYDVVRDPHRVRSAIGLLPENAGLYGRLTAREVLRYHGALYGLPDRTLRDRVDRLVELLDLAGFIDRRTESFSKGMRQRVCLARALVHDPDVLILDEPTAGLDVTAARAVRDAIRRLAAEGRCVVVSTHLMVEAERLCDRVAIVQEGRIRAVGTLDDLQSAADTGLEDVFLRLTQRSPEGHRHADP
ncbi:MAG: ABC transporter ATP-binding protein [Armatimonadota bacterium]|nr:ABC transporter ATP-binding protein [Armatimonadota bacterium]